jgi:uncharacterized membrane protein
MTLVVLSWIFAIPLLGGLTGLRAMTPMAVLCWFAYLGDLGLHRHSWAFWTTKLVTAIVFTVLAAGELVGDKLPQTPNRTDLFPLLARAAFGGLVGAICATTLHGAAVEGIVLGSIGAVAGAFVGFYLRQAATRSWGVPKLAAALTEDVLTIGLSILALGIVTG